MQFGALAIYESLYDIKEVSMSIFSRVERMCIHMDDFYKRTGTVGRRSPKPRAEMAIKGEGEYCSGDWCKFCKVAVRCRARAEEKLKLAKDELELPPLLKDAEVEEILVVIPDLTSWANSILA